MLAKLIDFVRTEIWRIRLDNLSRAKSFFIRQLRIIILALRGFDEDQCMLRASSLTFYSLLSIVPIIAMIFGISKGFGLEKRVQTELETAFQGQQDVLEEIVAYADRLLNNTSGGLVAGLGVVLLFWAIIKILGSIEGSFNHIWGVKKGRHLGRKFSDYLSFMLISPVLLVMAGSITVFITSQVTSLTQRIEAISVLAPLILFALKFLPYAVIWLSFSFVYFWMPNTRVRLSSCVIAGIAAGTLFQLTQWFYIHFQIGAAKYNAIYGSLAAWPLFLVWLQISWLIVLFGAEISFAHQNVETYEFEQDSSAVSHSFRMLLSLDVARRIIQRFCHSEEPWDETAVAHHMELPIRLARTILYDLVEAQVISEVKTPDETIICYQPARAVDTLTVKSVIDALEHHGSSDIPVHQSDQTKKIKNCLTTFDQQLTESPANIPLKDI